MLFMHDAYSHRLHFQMGWKGTTFQGTHSPLFVNCDQLVILGQLMQNVK